MPSSSHPRAPLSAAQLAEHFTTVEMYLRHAVEARMPVEVPLTSAVPGSGEADGWRLRLGCSTELVGPSVQWVAAFAIDALIDVHEDDIGGEPVWDTGPEVITSAVELPHVTAVLASWMLREGWLGGGSGFEACDAVDCALTFIGGELFTEERLRGTPMQPLPVPHRERARERREAFEVRDHQPSMSWAEFQASYQPVPGEGTNPFIDN